MLRRICLCIALDMTNLTDWKLSGTEIGLMVWDVLVPPLPKRCTLQESHSCFGVLILVRSGVGVTKILGQPQTLIRPQTAGFRIFRSRKGIVSSRTRAMSGSLRGTFEGPFLV